LQEPQPVSEKYVYGDLTGPEVNRAAEQCKVVLLPAVFVTSVRHSLFPAEQAARARSKLGFKSFSRARHGRALTIT
jgi:hypothetical protein